MGRYQKGKTNLDFTEARDSEWQWHQLGHMQVCTSLQTDNHASTSPLSFLQAGCPSCHPTNSVKALKVTAFRLVWVEFNAPPDTIEVISEAVFTANHLTDTDKQNSTWKYKQTQYKSGKVNNLKYSKTKLVKVPLTTLGQETRWAYSTMPLSPHGADGNSTEGN